MKQDEPMTGRPPLPKDAVRKRVIKVCVNDDEYKLIAKAATPWISTWCREILLEAARQPSRKGKDSDDER